MRIGIIGAGAIGGSLAALLADAGHDVHVTARGANLAAIRDRGLLLEGAFGTVHAHPHAAETLEHTPDAAILTTKTTDARAALEANAQHLADVPLLVVQNGIGGHERAARQLGTERVAGGIALSAVNAMEPGIVRATAAGPTYVGGREAALFLELFDGIVPETHAVRSLEGAQWTKLVINMVNAIPAIVGESVQATIADDELRRVLLASMRETTRTGLATGIRFETIQGLTPARIRVLAFAPPWLASIVPRHMAADMGDVPNLGSTQQSVRRGQRSEIDALNGAVVEAARAIGRTAPVNAGLVALVHEVEASGSFLPRERVLELSRNR